MSHIFISYARKDIDFAQKIVDALAINNLDTWIDWKSIPKGEDWEQEIYRGIEEADAFLFLVSPASVLSQMCNREIVHAVKNGKRILPIFISNVEDNEVYGVTEKFPNKEAKEEINRRNFIFCRQKRDDFHQAIEQIQKTIHTDYEWLKYHTKLQVKALDWERRNDPSRLLRGKECREAELQIANAGRQKDPQPTDLQRRYILESRNDEQRRIRKVIIASTMAGIAMIAMGVYAQFQGNLATNRAATAMAAQATALSRKLADEAQAIQNQPDLALLLSVQAYKINPTFESRRSLLTTLISNPYLSASLYTESDGIESLAFSTDGKFLLSTESDGKVLLWNVKSNSIHSELSSRS